MEVVARLGKSKNKNGRGRRHGYRIAELKYVLVVGNSSAQGSYVIDSSKTRWGHHQVFVTAQGYDIVAHDPLVARQTAAAHLETVEGTGWSSFGIGAQHAEVCTCTENDFSDQRLKIGGIEHPFVVLNPFEYFLVGGRFIIDVPPERMRGCQANTQ